MPVKALSIFASVLLVAAVAVGMAVASVTEIKRYAAAPGLSANGQQLTLTLTNHVSSNQTLGSINIAIPGNVTVAGIASGGITASGSKNWTSRSRINGSFVELRAFDSRNALAAGQWVRVTLNVALPCGTSTTWTTEAKQSNNFLGSGNDFTLDGPQPSVTWSGSGAPSLEVKTFPSPQEKGTQFSVTVAAKDACGNPGTGNVSMALLPGANTGTLTGTTPATLDANGEASFTDLVVTESGLGYKLRATWTTATDDSDPFDVVDKICGPGECSASDGLGTHVTTIVPEGGALTIRFSGAGGQLSCGSGALLGSRITLDPRYPDGTAPQEVVFVWANAIPPGVGVPHYTLCYEDDKGNPSIPLPKCSSTSPPTCELHRSRTGVADLRVRVMLAPVDPNFDLG